MSFSVILSKAYSSDMENQKFTELINLYFEGKLDDEGHVMLTEFLRDEKNRDYFDMAKQRWAMHPAETEISRRNWFHVQHKMHKQQVGKMQLPVSRRLWLQVASAAAILVIGILAGTVWSHFFSWQYPFSEPLVFETPRGEKSMVKLPDGSQVWLNANSRLICHSFTSKSRNVELTGEAFFKVARNEKSPFRVKTNECEVEVLGTEFNVMAYDDFGRKEITLLSGKVDVHLKNSRQVLAPDETLVIKGENTWITNTDAAHASAWVNNKFDFQNIPLSELMKRLENWYDVDIDLSNPGNKEVNFTGTFKNEETIWQVLDAIQVYMPIRYEKTDLRKIKISVE